VVAPLGVGGMGEVYRARDAKLNRDVALKVLPDAFALDPDRLTRFRREAQVLASLNHPHIAAIYGFEDSGEKHALVLELVEGPTVADLIAQAATARGGGAPRGLEIDAALAIARQISEALEAAHEQGVIHRDLKPANIKLRPDGTVKVLDFGLAKALEPASAVGATESPTITTPAMMTGVGVILGTAAYMSPEQARGRPAGKRSDVWAFGCVLYEMLTGKRAFDGEDVGETLAAVIKSEPDWTALPHDVPAAVRALIERCLEKDPRKRVADSSTASFVLREPSMANQQVAGISPSAVTLSPRSFVRRAWPIAATALIAGAVVGAAVRWSRTPAARPAVVRFQLAPADGEGTINGLSRLVGVSPDGTLLAYATDKGLYLRELSSAASRLVAGTEQALPAEPTFSPDGRSIAFASVSDRQLKVVSVAGGPAIVLCPIELPVTVSWTTNSIVFGQRQGIMRVSPNGGTPEQLVSVRSGELATAPQLLADGQTLLFTLVTGGGRNDALSSIVAQSLKSGSRQTLVRGGSNARVVQTGHLLYVTGGILLAVPFDQAALRVTGDPLPVVQGVARGATPSAQYSVSDSGSLLYLPGPVSTSSRLTRMAIVDKKGTVSPLNPSAGAYAWPRVDPDGRRIAYGVEEAQGFNIWIYDLDGRSAARRLTFAGNNNRFPVWSADGRQIVFQSDRDGDLALFRQPADVSGASAERLTRPEPGTAHVPESLSRPEDIVSVSVVKGATTTLWTLSMRDRKMTPFGDVRSTNLLNSEFSPDGHWIAYTVRGGPSLTTVIVEPYPATGARYQISKPDEVAHHTLWAPDGKTLFYVPGNQPVAGVSITTRPAFSAGNPFTAPGNVPNTNPFGEPRNFDVAQDGRWITVADPTASALTQTYGVNQMLVVLNWFEELKQRVPVK
jgi:serine/threonine-protein kinase